MTCPPTAAALGQSLVGLILLIPHAIWHESTLSFLGVGLPPEQRAELARVREVLNGNLPYVETADDADVDLSNPTVENPATAHLQPTPQLDCRAWCLTPGQDLTFFFF